MESKDERNRRHGLEEGAPRIPDVLARGRFVAVSARIGNDLTGHVCDWNEIGLLLDAQDPSGDATGQEFLPWHSIERVSIEEQ